MYQTVKRQSIFSILFGINEGSNIEEDIEITDKELLKTMKYVDKAGKETEGSIVTENKSSNGGGFTQKVDTPEINQETLNKMRKNLEKSEEREDNENVK